jgi:hypothetical protein
MGSAPRRWAQSRRSAASLGRSSDCPSVAAWLCSASVVRGLGSVTGGGGSGSGVPAVVMGMHCPLCRALTRLTTVADGSMASHRAHQKGCRTVFFVTPCRPPTSVGFSTTGGSNLRPASHECVDSSRPTPHLATDSTPTDCSDECREPSTNSSSLITFGGLDRRFTAEWAELDAELS